MTGGQGVFHSFEAHTKHYIRENLPRDPTWKDLQENHLHPCYVSDVSLELGHSLWPTDLIDLKYFSIGAYGLFPRVCTWTVIWYSYYPIIQNRLHSITIYVKLTYVSNFDLWPPDTINLKKYFITEYGLFPHSTIEDISIIQGKLNFIWEWIYFIWIKMIKNFFSLDSFHQKYVFWIFLPPPYL